MDPDPSSDPTPEDPGPTTVELKPAVEHEFAVVVYHDVDGSYIGTVELDARGNGVIDDMPAGGMVTGVYGGDGYTLITATEIEPGEHVVLGSIYPGNAEYDIDYVLPAGEPAGTDSYRLYMNGFAWNEASASGNRHFFAQDRPVESTRLVAIALNASDEPLAYVASAPVSWNPVSEFDMSAEVWSNAFDKVAIETNNAPFAATTKLELSIHDADSELADTDADLDLGAGSSGLSSLSVPSGIHDVSRFYVRLNGGSVGQTEAMWTSESQTGPSEVVVDLSKALMPAGGASYYDPATRTVSTAIDSDMSCTHAGDAHTTRWYADLYDAENDFGAYWTAYTRGATSSFELPELPGHLDGLIWPDDAVGEYYGTVEYLAEATTSFDTYRLERTPSLPILKTTTTTPYCISSSEEVVGP